MQNETHVFQRGAKRGGTQLAPGYFVGALALMACQAVATGQQQQITSSGNPQTTATQAVLSYMAPDDNPCTVDVRESGGASVVHDVDPSLFPGSHLDSRAGSTTNGRRRMLVVGKRAAELALDGRRYSRALQADTVHAYTITCGAATPLTGTFQTTNIPLGTAFMEGIPGDPTDPGATAWPSLLWNDRNQQVVDPQTGILLKRLTLSRDIGAPFNSAFSNLRATGAWTNIATILTDDSGAASYSGTTRDVLFLGLNMGSKGSYNLLPGFLSQLQVNLNGWCQGGDCATASADDRSLEFCLTIDGANCAGQTLTQPLLECSANCTGQSFRLSFGDDLSNSGLLAAWFATDAYAKPLLNPTNMQSRSGTVNRIGNQVTLTGGYRFDLGWGPGSKIQINSQEYTIASIDSDKAVTLSDGPVGTETGVPYAALNFGVLVRKKTASATPLQLQFAQPRVITPEQGGATWDPSGSYEQYTNCSNALVAGQAGEMGWHCHISSVLYWIGKDTGTAVPLGRTFIYGRAGVDGWPGFFCDGYWDKNNGNRYYCVAATPGTTDATVVQVDYNGQNQPGDISNPNVGLTECGSPPCWIFTNLAKPSQNRSLNQQAAAFDPATFPAFKNVGFRLLTILGATKPRLLLRAFAEDVTNDVMGYYVVFNTATGSIDGAGPSWKYWPLRWSALHGFYDAGDSNVVQWAPTFYRGPHTGVDPYRGYGPYVSRVDSGAIGTAGQTCPPWPSDSPIPQTDWPTGNNCLVIGVDGEPGDPTPKFTQAGTITTSGDGVTGTGVSWPAITNGYKMKIGTDFFVFTRTSSTTGTLSPPPPAVTDSAYTLFLEEVDNPKTGPNRREHAYLQDIEVRDVMCIASQPTAPFGGCGYLGQTEYFRLLLKSGNTWTLERGYNKKGARSPFQAVTANGYAIMVPPNCAMLDVPCAVASLFWDVDLDPLAQGPGFTNVAGTVANGAGHSVTRPTMEISANTQTNCPSVDGDAFSCYNVRVGTDLLNTVTNPKNQFLSGQPAFSDKLGVGTPNVVESHPSAPGWLTASLHPGEARWFIDARPLLGTIGVTGTDTNPAVQVETGLYKFTAAQTPKMRRKVLPPFGTCGSSPMMDASGPNSLLTGGAADKYKFCIADKNGECQPGSQAGEVFFNCPQMSQPYCTNADQDARDVCIGGFSSYTGSVVQIGYEKQNMTGKYGRPISKGLSRYRLFDFFWNAKSAPDGRWLFIRSPWANGFAYEALLAKLPSFPKTDNINRADFIPIPVKVGASADSAETHAVVEFGYDTNLYCTSRAEVCVKGSAASYAFDYENVAGVACATGCEIQVPAISQRVLYYRVVRKNGAGARLTAGPVEVLTTP